MTSFRASGFGENTQINQQTIKIDTHAIDDKKIIQEISVKLHFKEIKNILDNNSILFYFFNLKFLKSTPSFLLVFLAYWEEKNAENIVE